MIRHISADVLARYREGLVRSWRAARIRAHLAGCARCTELDSDLAGVSTLLANALAPPIPDRLAERLQMALSTESAERATRLAALGAGPSTEVSAEGAEPVHTPGRPDLPERRPRQARRVRMRAWSSPLVLRGLAAAGAVVLVAGAGYLFASNRAAPSTSAGSTSSPGHAGSAPRPAANRSLHAAGLAGTGGVQYRQGNQSVTTAAFASDYNYTPANLAAHVRKNVASSPSLSSPYATTEPRNHTPTGSSPKIGGMRIAALEGCLSRISAGEKVLLADVARYLGKPALIVVMSPLTAATVFDVEIVGLTCSASTDDIISRVEVPRG